MNNVIIQRKNKIIYYEDNKCIKLFDNEFKKSDILNEALNHARAEETGLNVPKILEVTKIDGKWAIVLEYINGKTLAQFMKENPEKKPEYIELMVDIQIEIFSKKAPLMNSLHDKMNRKINQTKLDDTVKYELHERLESLQKHSKVCHGDFNPSNIIISEDGKPYIIDWSHATRGNASADAARTYLLFCLNNDEESAKMYLELFCKKTNTAFEYVQKWMPIVAASQTIKGNENEIDFLLSWVNVGEY